MAFKVASFEMNFFRIAGTLEAETLITGKAECLIGIGEDKKVSFLRGSSPLTLTYNQSE